MSIFEMLDFRQCSELIDTAIENYNEEIIQLRWIVNYEHTGMKYEDFKRSLDNKNTTTADHRSAAEIDRDTAARFAAAGM